jgi:ubiquinone/menaquinone biosynthesis C-methylase UbiE
MQESQDSLAHDPSHILIDRFFREMVPALTSGHVVEIGSRTRSDISRRDLILLHLKYTGFDIIEGNNVDIVGDAHRLTKYFKKRSVDMIYSMSVFEHFAMPWKAVIEMNKVMKKNGIMMHTSHQTWPLHELPWDYWRYSEYSWYSLFNKKTGFEILDVKMGEAAHTAPDHIHPGVQTVSQFPFYLNSVVICRKIGNTRLKWNMDISDIETQPYPY